MVCRARRTIFDSANYARWRSIGIGDRGMGVLDDEAPMGAPRMLESTLVRPDLRAVSLSSGCLKPLHPLDVQCQTHQVPLARDLVQAAQAESAETEHLLAMRAGDARGSANAEGLAISGRVGSDLQSDQSSARGLLRRNANDSSGRKRDSFGK